jgi:hypothetical protein
VQTWELWYPGAAATGLLFARGRLDPTTVLWVHAAPDTLAVTVRDDQEQVVVRADELRRVGERLPMTRLAIDGKQLRREDRWPSASDLGTVVILHGGEVGRLVEWWNAPEGNEWRWRVEFYNRQ